MSQPILTTEALEIGYAKRGQTAVSIASDLALVLQPGELVCLLGPNGVGKSTLMRTLAGMQRPLAGTVWLDDQDLHQLPAQQLARQISVVLTERIDVGILSAYALVGLGRTPYTDWSGKLSQHDEQVVRWAITAVGAETLAHRPVNELSDGERQKVMIARALAQEPAIMLLDEPTAYLDLPRRVEVMQILRRLAHEEERAVLLSTHDLDLALRMADKIWLMDPQRPLTTGAPEDLVLSGAFAHAFAGQGVAFDLNSGSFHIEQASQGRVTVRGEGPAAIWTRRAVERAGFTVTTTDQAQWTVESENGRFWLHANNQQTKVDTLAALLKQLEALAQENKHG